MTLQDAGRHHRRQRVVDLAFEENGVWTVVDYKTDREIESEGEDRYRRQIALYATAIANATGSRHWRAAQNLKLRIKNCELKKGVANQP